MRQQYSHHVRDALRSAPETQEIDQSAIGVDHIDKGAVSRFGSPEMKSSCTCSLNGPSARIPADISNGLRILHVDDLSLNLDTLEVMRAGQRITLTRTGLQILEQLMRRPGHVLSRRALETMIWGDSVPDSDVLRTHIHALRSAIDKPFPKPLLHTVHGIGYRLGKSDDIQK